MTAAATHRKAIVRTAVGLFRKQGYAATGLNEILARSGAPKGSLYHYFPGGKAELGAEAVRAAGAAVTRTLASLCETSPTAADALRRYADQLALWMAQSSWRDGCPITTTLLETAAEAPAIAAEGRAAFAAWSEVLAQALVRDGVAPARAKILARFAVSALEGALIQARVQRDAAPLAEARDLLAGLFEKP
jgi:TetR/AcrR family transcriptional repressor of lmrAB and yxaGH operons